MFSYEYCEIFKNTSFEEHLQTAASVIWPWLEDSVSMPTFYETIGISYTVNYQNKLYLWKTNHVDGIDDFMLIFADFLLYYPGISH